MTEIIKVVAWPVAILVCFIFACICFRRHIAALLDRTTSVGKDGLKTVIPTGQSTQEIDRLKQSQELVEALTSPVLREREGLIRAELKKRGLDESGETVKVLIRYLATAGLINTFEELYRIIFGSQIYVLKSANENRPSGVSEEFIDQHFDQIRRFFAPTYDDWNRDQYMDFLLKLNLMVREAGFYRITNLGVEFLGWMTKVGAIEKKGL
jgi:hypothetical protein